MPVSVISTMTDSVAYTIFSKVGDLPIPKKKILIRGGASLPSLKSGFGDMSRDEEGHPIWTADGVATIVSDADWEILKDHWLFVKHQEGGKLKVVTRDITDDYKAVKKEIKTMETDWKSDPSKQITPATLKERVGANKLKIHEADPEGTALRI